MIIETYALICYAIHDKTIIDAKVYTDISTAYSQMAVGDVRNAL